MEIISKEILKQYNSTKGRIKDVHKAISVLQGQLRHMEECQWKRELLLERKKILEKEEQELLMLTNRVEEYLQLLKDKRMRRILSMRYLENFSWIQIANKIGGPATADALRMEHSRFINNKKK